MYQVLARKWRPQTFDELIGQQHVARPLRNAVQAGRTAHAYIFGGLRGTGKTTVARILAKCLNCEQGPTPSPCGECVPCVEIADGCSIDVMEMDAASRTGVDNIRELQEVVSYAPVRDRHKVLIIDEAHMLSKAAFNALLKTLEEPPPRVVFVLATTELQKVIPTILSRCQVFEFRRVAPHEVSAHLRKLCDVEKIAISDHVLDRIARAGEGSVRDSLSVLERVLAFCGSEISDEEAMDVLGAVRTEVLARLLQAVARRDAGAMLSVLDSLVAEGHDLLHVWSEWIGALRDLLLRRVLPDRADLLSRSADETASLEASAEGLSREDLVRVFHVVSDLEPGLKASGQPRFLFEAALIRLADLGAVKPIEEVLAALEESDMPAQSRSRAQTQRGESPQKKNRAAETPSDVASPGRPPERSSSSTTASGPGGDDRGLERFREAVHEARPLLDAILDEAKSIRLDDGRLDLVFTERTEALRRQIEQADHQDLLRRVAEEVIGGPVRVSVLTSADDGENTAPEPPPVREDSGGPVSSLERDTTVTGVERQGLLERARKEPGVSKLLLEFGAQVVEIRPMELPGSLTTDGDDSGPAEETQ